MANDRFAFFVNKLAEKTRQGSIEWQNETSNSFSVVLGSHKVSISQNYPEDAPHEYMDPDYIIGIYMEKSGEWVESMDDQELKEFIPNSFKLMADIYKSARRKARDFDSTIETLIDDLEDPF